METSLDLLAWRDSLAGASAVPSAAELAEWAGRLTDAGCAAEAALLGDVAALHGGFSPQAQAARRSPAPPASRTPQLSGRGMLDRAAADLRELARRVDPAAPGAPAPWRDPGPAEKLDDVAELARRLRGSLERAWRQTDKRQLVAPLTALAGTGRRLPTFDYRPFARSPLALLASAIATAALVDFAMATRDLWSGAIGSPALFHHIARLDQFGLGPYLSNVGGLARDSRDVLELAHLAQAEAAGAGVDIGVQRWVVLLSRGCEAGLLRQIVDDLGDMAASDALSSILDRASFRLVPAIDQDMIRRLRDAGLDNGDFALAARAQRALVRLRPDDMLEGAILGSVEASGGEFGAAEAVFSYWLTRAPDDQGLRERLAAVRAGRFERFAIPHGFGSPADRRDVRLRRRGVLPDGPRRRGERIRAVDVG